MPKKDPTYERIERALFKDKDEATTLLSPREMEIKKRMMLCVSKKMEEPLIPDTELSTTRLWRKYGTGLPIASLP